MATSLAFCSRQVTASKDSKPVTRALSKCRGLQVSFVFVRQMMEDTQSDFTMTFRQLSELSAQQLRKKDFTQVEPKARVYFLPPL